MDGEREDGWTNEINLVHPRNLVAYSYLVSLVLTGDNVDVIVRLVSICHQDIFDLHENEGRPLNIMMTSSKIIGNHFSRYWPSVRGISHRPPVNSPHKGQLRGALLFSLI